MFIKTASGWRQFYIVAEVPSDHPDYRGEHGPCLNLQDPWADKLNREAQRKNKEKALASSSG